MLIELIQKRRIENRRVEIANNAREVLTALKAGTAKRGNLAQLKADLFELGWLNTCVNQALAALKSFSHWFELPGYIDITNVLPTTAIKALKKGQAMNDLPPVKIIISRTKPCNS